MLLLVILFILSEDIIINFKFLLSVILSIRLKIFLGHVPPQDEIRIFSLALFVEFFYLSYGLIIR